MLVHKHDLVLFPQGKTHTLKPSAKDHVLAMAKGPPAQPMEDISMRIYLCEGLLGMFCSLVCFSTSSYGYVKQRAFILIFQENVSFLHS